MISRIVLAILALTVLFSQSTFIYAEEPLSPVPSLERDCDFSAYAHSPNRMWQEARQILNNAIAFERYGAQLRDQLKRCYQTTLWTDFRPCDFKSLKIDWWKVHFDSSPMKNSRFWFMTPEQEEETLPSRSRYFATLAGMITACFTKENLKPLLANEAEYNQPFWKLYGLLEVLSKSDLKYAPHGYLPGATVETHRYGWGRDSESVSRATMNGLTIVNDIDGRICMLEGATPEIKNCPQIAPH